MQAKAGFGVQQTGLARRNSALAAHHAAPARPQAVAQPSVVQHVPLCAQPMQQCRIGLNNSSARKNRLQSQRMAALVADKAAESSTAGTQQRPLKVLIAGAGIGGLVLAVALVKKGIDVAVFERDLTAIRGEGKYRGPIQVGRPVSMACLMRSVNA